MPKLTEVPKDIAVPEGWTARIVEGRFVLLEAPWGFVTLALDLPHRGYRGGMSTWGKLLNTKSYGDRGWMKRLTADAVAWLQSAKPKR